MYVTDNFNNLVSLPDEIILNICEKVSELYDLSDLLNLRLVSQQLNRISSEPKLYKKFAKEYTNLKALNSRNVTEVSRDSLQRYYKVMCCNFWFPNITLDQANVEKEIDKQIKLALGRKFTEPTRQIKMNGFIHKFSNYLSYSQEINDTTLRLIIKKIDRKQTTKEQIFLIHKLTIQKLDEPTYPGLETDLENQKVIYKIFSLLHKELLTKIN